MVVTQELAARVLAMIGFEARCEAHQRTAEAVTIATLETLRAALAGSLPANAESKS